MEDPLTLLAPQAGVLDALIQINAVTNFTTKALNHTRESILSLHEP
jgi:hypothetical protein